PRAHPLKGCAARAGARFRQKAGSLVAPLLGPAPICGSPAPIGRSVPGGCCCHAGGRRRSRLTTPELPCPIGGIPCCSPPVRLSCPGPDARGTTPPPPIPPGWPPRHPPPPSPP